MHLDWCAVSIETIRQQLSTPQGFAKGVSAKRGVQIGAITCLVVGLGCIAMNLFQLGSASRWNWSLMTRYFFDASAIEFSGSRAGRAEMWHFLYVWAPVVLIPVGIVLLVIHLATKSQSAAGLFGQFQERGWVGRQAPVGLAVKNGNAQAEVTFVSHPSIPDDVFQAAVQHYAQYVQTLDKKGVKEVSTAAAKQGVLTGTFAESLLPGAPAGLVAATRQGNGEYVVVVPPAPGANSKLRVLAVKA